MSRAIRILCTSPALLLFFAAPATQAAEIEKYDDGPYVESGYPFSESARVGDLLFLAGQIGDGGDGKLVPGGIVAETEQVMLNIEAALARRGLRMDHVVKCTVFLADIAEWAAFNDVYRKHFTKPYPARSALGTHGLAMDARVELECIAGYPD
jgi:reactive intermediate/imine deaminase